MALIALVVVIVAAVVVVSVPSLRRRAVTMLQQARDALHVLRSPRKLLQLFGGNLVAQVMFAVACSACVRAFGEFVPLSMPASGFTFMISTVLSEFSGDWNA